MINIQDTTARFKSIFNNVCKILNEYHKKMAIDTINELFSKLSSNQTTIMVCGEFKRGKSTFINALLDMPLCPTDEHIATSTVSIIKYGEKQKVTRFYDTEDGAKEEIIEYKKINQFAKGSNLGMDNTIMLVIEVPCNRLKDGLTVIDTPGVGGLNPRHRFLTLSAIPKTDIIFYMVSVGEPMTTIELDFLKKDILPKSKAYKVILNRVDELEDDEIEEAINDSKKKICSYCDVDNIDVIPVSAYLWQEYNKSHDEIDGEASFHKLIEKAIDEICYTYRLSLLQILKNTLVDEMQSILTLIKKEQENLSDPNPDKIKKIVANREKLKNMLYGLQQDGSEIKKQVSFVLKEARANVLSEISKSSVLLSSDRLDEVLNDDRAVGEDGDKWVLDEINKDIQKLICDIDDEINYAFEESLGIIQQDLNIDQYSFNGQMEANLKVRERREGEVTCGMVRQVLPGLSVGGIGWGVASAAGGFFSGLGTALTGTAVGSLSVGLGALISTVALPVGIVACAAFIWQSLKGENNARKIADMRRKLTPRISLLTNEIQTYVNKRFENFNTAVSDYFEETAKELNAQMGDLQENYKKCQQDSLAIANRRKELESKLQVLNTALVQAKVLLSNSFH